MTNSMESLPHGVSTAVPSARAASAISTRKLTLGMPSSRSSCSIFFCSTALAALRFSESSRAASAICFSVREISDSRFFFSCSQFSMPASSCSPAAAVLEDLPRSCPRTSSPARGWRKDGTARRPAGRG